jgi:hypothetical protein
MAKEAVQHKRKITETLKFVGEISTDGLYIELDGVSTPTADLFKKFAGEFIEGKIEIKQEEEIV